MKKVRLVDIAQEAGVSVATVSYVLNNVQTQKVSEETKLKVMQIANLHNYKKNTFAAALANGKSKCVGIYIGKYDFSLTNGDILVTINKLTKKLYENGYNSFILTNAYNQTIDNVDAIICYGLYDEEFKMISEANVVPVIAVDCLRHIPWTFEICHVYRDIPETLYLNDYILITSRPNSKGLADLILNYNTNVFFISNFLQLENLIPTIKDKNIVAGSAAIFNFLNARNILVYSDNFNLDAFVNKITTAVSLAIEHKEIAEDEHIIRI